MNLINLSLTISTVNGCTISRQHYSHAKFNRIRDRYDWITQLIILQQLKSFI